MTTTINRKQLAAALKIVAPAVSRDHAHPALHGVRIVGGPGERLTLTATNLDLTISHNIYTDGDQAGVDLLVPAGALTRMVSSMSGETVAIEPDDVSVEIRSGRTKASLATIDVAGWPQLPALDAEVHELTAEQVELVRRVTHAASVDKSKPVYNGVHFDGSTARATDSYRLATVPLDLGEDWAPISLPGPALATVLGVATEGIYLQATTNAARLTAGDTTWTTRLAELTGGYPSFDRLVRDKSEHSLCVNRDALIESLGRVLTISGEGSLVKLSVVDGELTLTCSSESNGKGDTIDDALDIEAETGGAIPDLGLNGHFLVDLLKATTADEVVLEIEDAMRPVMVHDGEWTGLIMPVRIG